MDASHINSDRNAEARLLDLIDAAYAMGEDPDWIERFFDEAHTYIFNASDGWRLASDLPAYGPPDPAIARHEARILRLSGRGGSAEDMHSSLHVRATNDALARIMIDARGNVRWMNKAASEWLGITAATRISDLPLDPISLGHIREALAKMREGIAPQGSLHPMMRDHDGHSTLGVLRMVLTDDEPTLALSLTDVVWTDERVARIARALSLTPREGDVLRGMLEGLSQREIAERSGKSVDTIKAQAKALLARTGLSRMSDLVLLATSVTLLDDGAQTVTDKPDLSELENSPARLGPGALMAMPDGRELEYRTFGAPKGRPIVFFHALQLGPFFPPSFERALIKANLKIIAPSRPSFGRTSAALKDENYNRTVVDDTLRLIERLDLRNPLFMVHQGGVSHAYRVAAHMQGNLRGMVMIGAGIPIEEDYIREMNKMTRLAAIAVLHTPSVFDLISKLGIRHWRSTPQGPRKYLENFYKDHPIDLAELDDPEIFPLLKAGLFHLTDQGTKALRLDGVAAMEDWSADYHAVTTRTEWLHPAECPVMAVKFVDAFLRKTSNTPLTVLEGTGYHVLYDRQDEVLDLIKRAADWPMGD
ncbi:helix-turn-helix domain-containing protein [Pontivivens insulae]|nr:helix-turn-helix transcriptional regulator [Pontivivens insulae]